jgi:2-isopropylmalate synthase
MGEVSLKMTVNDRYTIVGRGASTDILEASAKAYVDGLNKIRERMDGESAAADTGNASLKGDV